MELLNINRVKEELQQELKQLKTRKKEERLQEVKVKKAKTQLEG